MIKGIPAHCRKMENEEKFNAEKRPLTFTSEAITFMMCVLPGSSPLIYGWSSGCEHEALAYTLGLSSSEDPGFEGGGRPHIFFSVALTDPSLQALYAVGAEKLF